MRGLVRLSAETDRVYTINLGKVLLSPDNRRAKRAINMIREFARHHMGISEVKIDMDVSHIIWSKGIRSPPRKIRVRMRKTDEGNILISKYEADPTAPSKVEDAKAKPDDAKKIPAKEMLKQMLQSKPADTKKIPSRMLNQNLRIQKRFADPADSGLEAKRQALPGSKPAKSKNSEKNNARPAGNKDDAYNICKKLAPMGFRIIPCILIPSEKNAPSAKFLNLDWSSYSQNTREFIKSVHETAGDVLLTSPSDMQTAASILNEL